VAHHAGHGGGGVETGEREGRVVVIEGCARPVRRAVARIARRREAGACVRRRVGVVVIRLVARDACGIGRRQAVIAVHVTSGARHRAVETRQREAGCGVIKRPVTPIRRGVALIAGCWEGRLRVIGIRRAVEVRHVALSASATGQAVVIVYVALSALQRSVRARQSETSRCVVEGRGGPIGRAMARLAGLRESSRRVRRIIRAIEIRQVAADASRVRAGQVVIAIHVALRALQGRVRAGQREARRRVIKGRIAPARGCVALLAGLREVGLHVIRVRRAVEIGQVAADAGGVRGGQVVVVIDVALGALQGRVRAGQREAGGRVIEGRARPGRRVMALLAGLREARRHVIRVGGALEIGQVAADARRIRGGQVVVVIDVAMGALQGRVRAGQREAGGRVIEGRARPGRRVMALLAGLREARRHVIRVGGALEIGQVAADARRVRGGQVVVVIDVATRAGNGRMGSSEWEPSRRVIKRCARPRGCVVALFAGLRDA
jgi:hypothetical protein